MEEGMILFTYMMMKMSSRLVIPLLLLAVLSSSAEPLSNAILFSQNEYEPFTLQSSPSDNRTQQRDQEMILEYRYRYHCNPNYPDHLLSVIEVSGDRLVIGGNQGLVLVERSSLTPEGSDSLLHRLTGLNAREVYLYQQNYLFVNLNGTGENHEAGFAVVRIDGNTLAQVAIVSSTDTFLEKMTISGEHLYVAAHSGGIHVYNITDPETPYLAGQLQEGFVDAFAISVVGDTAYVADGAGGLKVVDISNPDDPVLVAGETMTTAIGTAEDVACRDGKVFLAAGAAGVAVYDGADLSSRTMIATGGVARSFTWIEDKLAVSTIHGVVILQEIDSEYQVVTGKLMGRRGINARLRLCGAIGTAESSLLLCANWNSMDVYELVDFDTAVQPDICCIPQRVRFHPAGESISAILWNNGATDLQITGANVQPPSFSTDLLPATVAPGDTIEFHISYNGSQAQSSGMVRIHSNDPDESPYPIQLFGDTDYLDPGDLATDFTLPLYSRDHQTGVYSWDSFTLSEQLGKVVWFQAYGSW